jgi:hypothetical protein
MTGICIICCSFTSLSLKVASTSICTRAGVGCHGTRGMHVRILTTDRAEDRLKLLTLILGFISLLTLLNYCYVPSYNIVLDLGRALRYLHEDSVLHGDIKPCNILLDSQHVAKLADFGVY